MRIVGRDADDEKTAPRVDPRDIVCGARRRFLWSPAPARALVGRAGAQVSSWVALGPRPLGVAGTAGLGARPLGAPAPWVRLEPIPLGGPGPVEAGSLEVLRGARLQSDRALRRTPLRLSPGCGMELTEGYGNVHELRQALEANLPAHTRRTRAPKQELWRGGHGK